MSRLTNELNGGNGNGHKKDSGWWRSLSKSIFRPPRTATSSDVDTDPVRWAEDSLFSTIGSPTFDAAPQHDLALGFEGPDWRRGHGDGQIGQPPGEGEAVVEVGVREYWKRWVEQRHRRAGQLKAEVEIARQEVERLKLRLDSVQHAFQQIWMKKQMNYHAFSRPLAWLYLIFGVILLLSDIPLSLKLVAVGFGVRTTPPDGVKGLTVDDFFYAPLAVFGQYWEAIMLALGVAAVGIFVKYFFDLIVLRDQESEVPPWWVKIVMVIVLTGFCATIYVLGVYRAEIQVQATVKEIVEEVENESVGLISQDLSGYTPEKKAELIRERTDNALKSAPTWTSVTFVALTLLIPVVGGICFSASGSRFRHAKQFNALRDELRELEGKYAQQVTALHRHREEYEAETKALAEEQANPSGESLAKLRVNLYRHGYERGRHAPAPPEEIPSLYDWCWAAVSKLLASKSR
jgi:hypothetical protein